MIKNFSKENCITIGLSLTLFSFVGIVMVGLNAVSVGLAIASLIPFRWAYIKHMTW